MFTYRISSFFTILFFVLTAHSLLTRKKTIRFCIVAFILNTLFIFLNGIYLTGYTDNEGIVKVILYFISFFYIVYLNLVFEESLSKKVFTFFSIWLFSTIALFIATPFAELVSGIDDINYTQNLIYIFRNFINILFLLAAYFGIGKHYKAILNLVSDKTIRYMSLYPVIAFLLLITNFTTPTHIAHLRNFNSIYDMILFLSFIIVGYVLVFVGIFSASQIVSMQCNMERLELISKTDSLTGLYNRRYIMEKLENELINYKKTKNKFSIIIADIDYFKKINDNFGHDCGDQVLKVVSQNLRDAVQERGFVSRWGGEEFLILLPETEIVNASILADKIRKIIEEEIIEYNGIQVSLTLSFGVTANEDYEMIDDTIKKADDALYKGKGQGRNCVVSS
ncbi:GGDEF domain-containing protein [Clostridium sp. PL3]|uniref:GGDEF domain-containing protein n=1 Tax=Clostridium thailandense TaxID=2794346 RepID=A0A949X244_9CLOT|nr:GGDEF domain-containing protein [Clostridium thailandense]MBV7272779.1 GGDEF domain-containing protein [Clostridium thailandense]